MADLDELAIASMRLQNLYGLAIDSRDWSLFRTLFTQDVVASYPDDALFEGLDAWVAEFDAMHRPFLWTQHAMTTHAAGFNGERAWASCYGFCRLIHRDDPDTLMVPHPVYRDELRFENGSWKIARRSARLIMLERRQIRSTEEFWTSIEGLYATPSGAAS